MSSLWLWFQALLFYPMFLVYTKQVPICTAQFKFRGQIMCVFCMFELCYNMCRSTPLWISENMGRVRWALRLVVRKVWQGRLQASVGCLLHVVSSDIVVLLRSYTDYSLKIWQYSPKIEGLHDIVMNYNREYSVSSNSQVKKYFTTISLGVSHRWCRVRRNSWSFESCGFILF